MEIKKKAEKCEQSEMSTQAGIHSSLLLNLKIILKWLFLAYVQNALNKYVIGG